MNTPIKLPTYNAVEKIIEYENGELDDEQTIELFQHLIDKGTIWHLQGHYQRTAYALVQEGLCTQKFQ